MAQHLGGLRSQIASGALLGRAAVVLTGPSYIRMEFRRFLHTLDLIPSRVERRARGITIRLIGCHPTLNRLLGTWRMIESVAFTSRAGAEWLQAALALSIENFSRGRLPVSQHAGGAPSP